MSRKKQKNKFKNKTNRHHLCPQSRCRKGSNVNYENVVKWDVYFHRNWHDLFVNMTVEEIHLFIDIITKPDTEWFSRDFAILRGKIMRKENANTKHLGSGMPILQNSDRFQEN